jgi:ribosomal protein S18 acetylase RimI-like enzyme
MPLPILHDPTDPTPDNLVRLFHRTELHWVRHVGEETQLDAGVAFTNAALPAVWDANGVMDAALPPDGSPAAAVEEVEQHFARAGVPCRQWVMNPAAPAERVWPLAEHLTGQGWQRHPYDVMYRAGRAAPAANEAEALTIIPARASFRHARALADEAAAVCGVPQLADASALHLDDPHWDALVALHDGTAVACAGVLAVGELGRIDQVFVTSASRRRGIGRTMAGRVLEICARSLFKHVMLRVHPHDRPAIELFRGLGFGRIGEIVFYRQP